MRASHLRRDAPAAAAAAAPSSPPPPPPPSPPRLPPRAAASPPPGPLARALARADRTHPLHPRTPSSQVLASTKCDCAEQLRLSQKMIASRSGVLIYTPQEGRGIGLAKKIAAYRLQARTAPHVAHIGASLAWLVSAVPYSHAPQRMDVYHSCAHQRVPTAGGAWCMSDTSPMRHVHHSCIHVHT